MSEHLHNIDDFFKIPIEAYSEMPSNTVWEAIENNFDKNNHVQLKKKYQNLKRAAALLLVLLCGSIFFIILRDDKKEIVNIERGNTQKINATQNDAQSNLPNSTTQKINNSQAVSPTPTLKDNETAHTSLSQSIDVQNEKIGKGFKSTATIFKHKLALQNKKVKQNTIYSNEEMGNNDEDYYSKKLKLKSTTKTNINITNGIAIEDELIQKESSPKNNILQASIISLEKMPLVQNIFKPWVYFPTTITALQINTVKDIANKTKRTHLFSATIFASPELSFNRLEDDKFHQDRTQPSQSGNRPRDDRDKIKREEHKATSFSAGVLLNYSFCEKITIQSGIGFTSTTTEVRPKKVFAEQNAIGEIKYKNNCSLGATYINSKAGTVINVGDSAMLDNTKNTLQYISVPLNILYHFQVRKFQISPMLGVAANILVKQKVTTRVEGDDTQKITKIEGVNKNYFNANIGVDFAYKIGKNISLNGMPNARIGLNPLNKNSNVKFYSNALGFLIGMKYHF